MDFIILKKDILLENIGILQNILRDMPHEYWNKQNFIKELPHKWELSILLKDENLIAGFLIASVKKNNAHIHKFIIAKQFRNKKYGKLLLEHFETVVKENFDNITLKVYNDNTGAIRFYLSNGFVILSKNDELTEMIKYLI